MSESIQSIHFIATGGTFEKHYNELNGELVFTETHLPAMLGRARVTVPFTCETVCLIDSLDMVDAHRQKVLDACQKSDASQVVIVHGTDTMRETAEVLGKAGLDKTVVLTGAMVPYEFDHSDAFFNLGVAVGAVQLLPKGVYVMMNGRAFSWNHVKKNRQAGRFEAV